MGRFFDYDEIMSRGDFDDFESKELSFKKIIGGVVAAILLLTIVFGGCFRIVDVGEVGVVTRFGEVVGVEGQGFHVKTPFDNYTIIEVHQQQVTASYSTATADNQSLTQTITAQIVVDPEHAGELYSQFLGNHMDGIVAPTLADGFKTATAKYTIEQVISSRDALGAAMLENVKTRLAVYGINVVSVEVIDVTLPEDYKNAVEAKKVAEQTLAKAEVERQQAEVEAETNRITAQSLSNANFQKMFYDKWNGELPLYFGAQGGLSTLLPSISK